jgi:hypothetical protein
VGQGLDAVDAVIAKRDPPVRDRDRQQPAARGARVAAHLEDVRAVHPELELHGDRRGLRSVVDDADALLEPVGTDQALPGDADRPTHELVERMDLGVGVAIGGRVRHLDAAAVVAPDRGLEQDRPDAPDAQDGARQRPRVAAIQPETA